MTTTQKIFGGGASYQTDIFNDLEHPINSEVVTHYERDLNLMLNNGCGHTILFLMNY